MIGVDGSTGIRMPRTSCSPAVSSSPAVTGVPPSRWSTSTSAGSSASSLEPPVVEVGLEQPVLRRSINPQPGGSQAVGGQFNVGLSHDKIDIVARLRATVYPKGISPTQRKGDAVGLEG